MAIRAHAGRGRGRRAARLALAAAVLLGACDRDADGPAPPRDSVLGLMMNVARALRRGSEPELAALLVDLDDLRRRCPEVPTAHIDSLESARVEHPPSECVALTDWSALQRGIPQFPLSNGLNVDTKICDEAWHGCAGVTRMCKSEIFYFEPQEPKQGYKVNLGGIARVGDEYALLRPPHCMRKRNER